MGLGGISLWQLLIILAIVVLIFGTRRLRNIGSDLGGAVKGFKDAMKEGETEEHRRIEKNGDDNEPKEKFDVGFSELVLIAVLALVIAGPEHLPGIMRTLGRLAGRARATVAVLRTELEREVERAEQRKDAGEGDDRDGDG